MSASPDPAVPTADEIARVVAYQKRKRLEEVWAYIRGLAPNGRITYQGETVDASWPIEVLLGLIRILDEKANQNAPRGGPFTLGPITPPPAWEAGRITCRSTWTIPEGSK